MFVSISVVMCCVVTGSTTPSQALPVHQQMYWLLCKQVASAFSALEAIETGTLAGWPSIQSLLNEAAHMRECQELFEIYVVDYIYLTHCQVTVPRGSCCFGHVK